MKHAIVLAILLVILSILQPCLTAPELSDKVSGAWEQENTDDGKKKAEEYQKKAKEFKDGENPYKRELEIENDNKEKVTIKSKVKNGKDKAEYEFVFRYNGFPLLKAEYKTKSSDNESKYRFGVGFFELVEFNSTISAKDSTRRFKLRSNNGNWTTKVSDNTLNNIPVKVINATFTSTNQQYPKVVFSIEIYALTDAIVNSTVIAPNNLKYSIWISGFNYGYENSKLGLVQFVRTKSVNKANTKNLELDGGNLTWSSTVSTDKSKNTTVTKIGDISTGDSVTSDTEAKRTGESDNFMVIAFDATNPNFIYWDPAIILMDPAVDTSTTTKNSATKYSGFGTVIAATILAMTMLF